ncbi:hypothetical protein [Acidovorax sp. RAC01]|uniref:hypothetical protein n=1 Tax=Acidovorax sp. RAC01 TaxID=1842533 RepID=UPI000855B805|nr:hypothetical protein [Acidovorax sp. RAC01]AOG22833.1 hypothetical protein BSY15_431 [Acidovorax sp. RAC01]
MSAATTAGKQCHPAFVDLDCHVLPLLDAIVWMGQASYKLSEIDALNGSAEGVQWIDQIAGPEFLNVAELASGVAWVAASLLRRHQCEQDGAVQWVAA